jgi:flagellar basal-body rod modification protein FlgD
MADSVSGLSLDSITGAYSKYSNTTTDTSSGDSVSSYMDFESYLKVLAAQMSNQDFNDPMSDSEMLQQMASYSMLEGIQNMTNQSNISYAASLVGKAITVNNGGTYDTGIVDSVVVDNNTPYLIINGDSYEVDNITNIADSDTYNKLSLLVGYNVDVNGGEKSGQVTNVLIIGGEGYVVLDGSSMYSLSDISLSQNQGTSAASASTSASTSTDSTDEENTDAEAIAEAEAISNTDDGITASDDETSVDSQAVSASLSSDESSIAVYSNVTDSLATMSAGGYKAQSQALFDELMSTIDSISGTETETETETSVIPDLSGYETVTVSYIKTPDYAAGVYANNDEILETLSSSVAESTYLSSNSASSSSASSSGSHSLRSGDYDITLTTSNLDSVAASTRDGRVSSILTNDEVRDVLEDDTYNTRYSTRYGLEVQSDTKPGISTSDCEAHRLNADEYPAEAALADSLGTRMYDIKYINNTAITSRIDTSTVIGTTMSGREITEIGYSGVGKLGEVVTFKDGTQRVEILLDNGNSCWFNTSGNYTLDEICDFSAAPGSLSDLTPFEVAIRNYARQASSSDYASMASLKSSLVSMGVNVVDAD